MVKASQMENPVQRQHFDFLRRGVSQPDGILRRDIRRDRNLARHRRSPPGVCNRGGQRGKRQDVSGLVLASKLAVQRAKSCAASDQHIDRAAQSGFPARAQDEARERPSAEALDFLLQNHQTLFSRLFILRSCKSTSCESTSKISCKTCDAKRKQEGSNRSPPVP